MERKRLSLQDQIARLKEAQADLSALEQEWQAREVNESEVEQLRQELSLLQQHTQQQKQLIQTLQQEFRSYYAKSQGLFSLFSKTLHKQTTGLEKDFEQIHQNSSQVLENLIDIPLAAPSQKKGESKKTALPEPETEPAILAALEDDASFTQAIPQKPRQRFKLVKYSVAFALIAIVGWKGLHFMNRPSIVVAEQGQVAGVSTTAPDISASSIPTDDYSAAYRKVSYDNDTWKDLNDSDFYLKMQYPSDAMDIQRTDNNIFFLRQDNSINNVTYALKINTTAVDPTQSLDDWVNAQKSDYSDYTFTKSTFAGQTAYQALPTGDSSTAYYFLRFSNLNYTFGYRLTNKWLSVDDQKRQDQLMRSIHLTAS